MKTDCPGDGFMNKQTNKANQKSWREKPIVVVLIVLAIALISIISMFSSSSWFENNPDDNDIELDPTPRPSLSPSPEPASTTDPNAGLTPGLTSGPDTHTTPTPTLTPEVTPTPTPEPGIYYLQEGGKFELPVNGATGYAAVRTEIYDEPDAQRANNLGTITAGRGFVILDEGIYHNNSWWKINTGNTEGWILNRYCFINMPDVLPSIVYKISNASASLMRSGGFEIPNVTDQKLYDARSFNQRLDREEYIVPVLYETAIMLSKVQQAALANGNTIIMYEAFRPRETQRRVVSGMERLMETNQTVNDSLTTPPWSLSFFISTSLSNHQRGAAVDVSLGKVLTTEEKEAGNYKYINITGYDEYQMPTVMHELSPRAAAHRTPVTTNSYDAWKTAEFSQTMTDGAKIMYGYFTQNGFTPLSSEWWHFNALDSRAIAVEAGINGEFIIDTIYSIKPTLP